jgi:hypothetical protein
MYPFIRLTGVAKSFYDGLKSNLFFSGLISVIIEGYLEFTIAIYMNY